MPIDLLKERKREPVNLLAGREPERERPTGPEFRQAPDPSMWERFRNSVVPGIDPERATQAMIDSEALNISPGEAYDYQDELKDVEAGDPRLKNLRLDTKERVMRRWDRGVNNAKTGLIGYELMFNDTPELQEALAGLSEEDTGEPLHKGFVESAIGATAEMLPIMLQGTGKGLERGLKLGAGAAVIAGVAGQAGPQVAVPEEIITMPVAYSGMFAVGMASGTLENIGKIEAGLGYLEMLKLKDTEGKPINPIVAKSAAAGIGIINGLIEVAQIKTLLKTIPGGDKLFRASVQKTIIEVMKSKTLMGIAKKYLGRQATFVASETGQEIAQESTTIVATELSKQLTNELEGTDFPKADITEIANRIIETAIESAKAFTVMGLPGTVVSAGEEAGVGEKVAEFAEGLGERGGFGEEFDASTIPEDLKVEVTAIHEKTGKEVKIKENAKVAYEETIKNKTKYQSLLDCLNT